MYCLTCGGGVNTATRARYGQWWCENCGPVSVCTPYHEETPKLPELPGFPYPVIHEVAAEPRDLGFVRRWVRRVALALLAWAEGGGE